MVIKFSYERYLSRYKTIFESIPAVKAQGFHICSVKDIIFTGSLNYTCSRGGMILFIYLCDGIFDCPNDQSDEDSCSCDPFYVLNKKHHIPCKKIFAYAQKTERFDQITLFSMNLHVKETNTKYQMI